VREFLLNHPIATILLFLSFIFSVVIVAVEVAIMRRMKTFTVLFDRAMMVMQSFDPSKNLAELRGILGRDEQLLQETAQLARRTRERQKEYGTRIANLEQKVFPLMPKRRPTEDDDTQP
jgi:hypothetical protein